MKIYHTETQADYDALMAELEKQGCKWAFGRELSEVNNWHISEHLTCLRVYDSKVNHASLNYYKEEYPDTPIIKYKAKAEEKMRFTKENVYKAFSQYRKDSNFPFNDLQDEILKLDDTPEKVVVPKFVAEWIEQKKEKETELQTMIRYYRYFYDNVNSYSDEVYFKKAVQWYVDNPYKFIQAYENGYTIEPEKLYHIPLPDLETSDGLQQMLSKRKGDKNYFASRPAETLKQRYTKEELEQVPEIYKPYAKPIKEEEK